MKKIFWFSGLRLTENWDWLGLGAVLRYHCLTMFWLLTLRNFSGPGTGRIETRTKSAPACCWVGEELENWLYLVVKTIDSKFIVQIVFN